tara:strand:+ start:298 stop:471 length:174 start_codon:yes stop_codon:yes gene_type:complete
MKCKVIGRVFSAGGELIPFGTEVERKSADGVHYEEIEVATPKPKTTRKPKKDGADKE